MAIQTLVTFKNCSSAVEDITNPENPSEVAGRAFLIIDNDNDTIYRFIMPAEAAKIQGQRLLGLGDVAIADGTALKDEIAKHKDGS